MEFTAVPVIRLGRQRNLQAGEPGLLAVDEVEEICSVSVDQPRVRENID